MNNADGRVDCPINKVFRGITSEIPNTEIGIFMDWDLLPPTVKDKADTFAIKVRNSLHGFTHKVFIVVYDGNKTQWNTKIYNRLKKKLFIHLLDKSKLEYPQDEDCFKNQVISFAQNNPNAHVMIISANSNYCMQIFDHENLCNMKTYWIHNLGDLEHDGALLQQPKESIHFNHFLESRLNTTTALDGQFSIIRAPEEDTTPLVILLDIENNIKHKFYGKLQDIIINNYVVGFDVKEFIIAIAEKNCNDEVEFELKKNQDSNLIITGNEKSAADKCLKLEGKRACNDYPNCHVVVVSSDDDFCEMIVEIRYYRNHPIYLLHKINNERSTAKECMIPSATQSIFFDYEKV